MNTIRICVSMAAILFTSYSWAALRSVENITADLTEAENYYSKKIKPHSHEANPTCGIESHVPGTECEDAIKAYKGQCIGHLQNVQTQSAAIDQVVADGLKKSGASEDIKGEARIDQYSGIMQAMDQAAAACQALKETAKGACDSEQKQNTEWHRTDSQLHSTNSSKAAAGDKNAQACVEPIQEATQKHTQRDPNLSSLISFMDSTQADINAMAAENQGNLLYAALQNKGLVASIKDGASNVLGHVPGLGGLGGGADAGTGGPGKAPGSGAAPPPAKEKDGGLFDSKLFWGALGGAAGLGAGYLFFNDDDKVDEEKEKRKEADQALAEEKKKHEDDGGEEGDEEEEEDDDEETADTEGKKEKCADGSKDTKANCVAKSTNHCANKTDSKDCKAFLNSYCPSGGGGDGIGTTYCGAHIALQQCLGAKSGPSCKVAKALEDSSACGIKKNKNGGIQSMSGINSHGCNAAYTAAAASIGSECNGSDDPMCTSEINRNLAQHVADNGAQSPQSFAAYGRAASASRQVAFADMGVSSGYTQIFPKEPASRRYCKGGWLLGCKNN